MRLRILPYYIALKAVKRLQRWLGLGTLGARAIVINDKGQILLVKHSYQPHWHLPGGGVDNGETPKAAVIRELKEEVGLIVAEDEPVLHGVYQHVYMGVNDYPIIYIVKNYSTIPSDSPEIEAIEWFDYKTLPAMISPGTKRRLNEYFDHVKPNENW